MSKIYSSRGSIIIEDVLPDIISINPTQFDWEVQNGIYFVRDKIQNQSYKLGIYSEIKNAFDIPYSNDTEVFNTLNYFVNKGNFNKNTSPLLISQLAREVANTTLTSPTVIDSKSISVASSSGIIIGSYIVIFNKLTKRSYQGKVISINGLNILLDSPIDSVFDVLNTKVYIGDTNINVNGSVTPVQFSFRADSNDPVDIEVNISRIIFTMELSTAGNLATFGNIPRLLNGILFRKENSFIYNIFNIKDNREIKNVGSELELISAIGLAPDGLNAVIDFQLIGSEINVKPGENILLLVQDDLSGIDKFEITCEGYLIN